MGRYRSIKNRFDWDSSTVSIELPPGVRYPEPTGSSVQEGSVFAVHRVQTDNYTVRSVDHQGRRHIVVPVIMMREGVHAGSHGPLYHPAAELGRFVESWNGMPVTVEHPQRDGENVSANSPDLIDRAVVGRVYNAVMDGGRLRAEAWIDVEKLRQISPLALGAISQQRPLEVSIGVFTDEDPVAGIWNAEEYAGIARNHRPDHLALLPGGRGACSWDDGCGIRANSEKGVGSGVKDKLTINAVGYSGTEGTAWSSPTLTDFDVGGVRWQDLSQADRAMVASHFLIGTATVETFGDLHFPVVNPGTGKLNEHALRAVIGSRGAQLRGVPADVCVAARRRAYRLRNAEFDADLEIPETLSLIKDLAAEGHLVVLSNQAQGYRELIQRIQAKLDRMDDDVKVHFLTEVFKDSFIYTVRPRSGGPSEDGVLYRRSYQADRDGIVEFTGESIEVRREVSYINVQTAVMSDKGGITTMSDEKKKPCCPAKVALLIQGEHSPWQEADREWLDSLEEVQIDKLVSQMNFLTDSAAQEKGKEGNPPQQITKEQIIQALREQLSTPEQYIELMPVEMRDGMRSAHRLHQARRAEMVKNIVANSRFSEDELKSKSTEELETLVGMIPAKVDYSGQVGGGDGYSEVDPNAILLPPGVEVYNSKGVKVNG